MLKVVIADGLSGGAIKTLEAQKNIQLEVYKSIAPEDVLVKLKGADIVILRSATKLKADTLRQLPQLKGIIRAGVGIDNVDLKTAEELGIYVWNAPRGNFQSTAEMAIAMMFALARQLPLSTHLMRQGQWPKTELSSRGRQIEGAVMGVFGAGNIGFKTARMARALGMQVGICDPVFQASGSGFEKFNFDDLLKKSDFIAIHAPLLPETKHVFNYEAFKKMKSTAFIINIARGGIIHEGDLLRALDKDLLSGAGLDVFEKEPPDFQDPQTKALFAHPKVILSPHMGASTVEAQKLVGEETVQKLTDIVRSANETNYRAPKPLNQPVVPRLKLNF